MELIKQIKQTEAEAQQIIEQAKNQAAREAEQGRIARRKALEQAEQERKRAIEAAISAAQTQGQTEVERLKAEATKQRKAIRDYAAGRTPGAVAKVVNHIRG